jgi:hypothetical protein
MSDFATSVALYRQVGRPAFGNGQFSYEGPNTTAIASVIAACRDVSSGIGRFVVPPEVEGDNVTFTWAPGHNQSACFYPSTRELVEQSTALSKGIRPENYYLVAEDHLAGDAVMPSSLSGALRLCDLVAAIGKLALTSADLADAAGRVLLFIQPASEKTLPKTIELVTHISPEMLALPPPDLRVLEELTAPEVDHQLHVAERRGFFRLAVADVLAEPDARDVSFLHLVRSWDRVLEFYRRNVDVYLSNFSFEKLRRDIATESVDYAGKLSKSLNDSTSKLLALPLSFAAIAAVQVSADFTAAAAAVLGALLLSILLAGLIQNQLLELGSIRDGFLTVFKHLTKEAGTDTEIGGLLDKARAAFNRQAALLHRVLWTVRCLAWSPPLLALGVLAWRFNAPFQSGVSRVLQCLLLQGCA